MSKLAEAKQILAERGRTIEGGLEDKNGCLCPIGALCVAYTGTSGQDVHNPEMDPYNPVDKEHRADLYALARAAYNRYPDNQTFHCATDYSWVFRYNDRIDRTDEQVLSLFDDAKALV